MLSGLNPTDLKRWIEENRDLFNPPFKTNRVIAHRDEFIVMILAGPNARLDFHREPGLAHSPRRGEGTWGLVIERKRKASESEEFLWFCERCDESVLARTVTQGDVPAQVRAIYEAFNADAALRTCRSCGYVFPAMPVGERLNFLQTP